MGLLGIGAFFAALGAGLWLLVRAGRGELSGGGDRTVSLFKGVVWFGLAAALFAAKLWPLAFMVLLAAGGVTAIEIWRERTIKASGVGETGSVPLTETSGKMSLEEASAILGIAAGSDKASIREAHRRLIGQLHPDRGGSDYLAAKINDARALMIDAAPPEPIIDQGAPLKRDEPHPDETHRDDSEAGVSAPADKSGDTKQPADQS